MLNAIWVASLVINRRSLDRFHDDPRYDVSVSMSLFLYVSCTVWYSGTPRITQAPCNPSSLSIVLVANILFSLIFTWVNHMRELEVISFDVFEENYHGLVV